MKKANDALEDLTSTTVSRRVENIVTKKTLAVIGVFFVSSFVISVTGSIARTGKFKSYNPFFTAIIDVFAVVNCSINIVIYGIFDYKFRETFKKIFCACLISEKRSATPIHMTTLTKSQA